jgi:L-alanine-DL-glutamate epimerase-like enolase superfamily enzyme
MQLRAQWEDVAETLFIVIDALIVLEKGGVKMQITDIKCKLMKIPIEKSVAWSWDPLPRTEIRYTLVKVETDEGIEGYGCVQLGSEVIEFIEHTVKPAFLFLIPDLYLAIGQQTRPMRAANFVGPRVSAIELALWDIVGKDAGKPVYKMLGAAREKVKAYVSTGELRSVGEHVKFAQKVVEEGFRAIKLRARRLKIEDDLEVVKGVRDSVGDDVDIMVDANQGWGYAPPFWSRRTALKFAKELEKLDVVWLEEPLGKDDLDGLAELRKRTDIQIAGGELEFGLPRFKTFVEKGCYDVIQADACFCGGILEMKKIASLCEAFGNQFIPHCWDPGLGIAANLQVIGTLLEEVCPYMEFPYDPPWTPEVRDCMLEEPIVAKNGFVKIPDKPGLGVEVNEEALEKYVA